MDLDLIIKVNRLWQKIYPFLATQILESYQRTPVKILELGPFSGGISVEMAKRYGGLDITIADNDPRVLEYFSDEIQAEGLSDSIKLKKTTNDPFVFNDCEFDLVVCRGVFFFLDEEGRLFQEIFRVLNKVGMAFIGGGFGKGTPREYIDEIADESRILNDLLGRKRITVEELEAIIDRAGLAGNTKIVKDGGLWVILDKTN